jgi:hypothetical protein
MQTPGDQSTCCQTMHESGSTLKGCIVSGLNAQAGCNSTEALASSAEGTHYTSPARQRWEHSITAAERAESPIYKDLLYGLLNSQTGRTARLLCDSLGG